VNGTALYSRASLMIPIRITVWLLGSWQGRSLTAPTPSSRGPAKSVVSAGYRRVASDQRQAASSRVIATSRNVSSNAARILWSALTQAPVAGVSAGLQGWVTRAQRARIVGPEVLWDLR
jgi:hypothetical protein